MRRTGIHRVLHQSLSTMFIAPVMRLYLHLSLSTPSPSSSPRARRYSRVDCSHQPIRQEPSTGESVRHMLQQILAKLPHHRAMPFRIESAFRVGPAFRIIKPNRQFQTGFWLPIVSRIDMCMEILVGVAKNVVIDPHRRTNLAYGITDNAHVEKEPRTLSYAQRIQRRYPRLWQ